MLSNESGLESRHLYEADRRLQSVAPSKKFELDLGFGSESCITYVKEHRRCGMSGRQIVRAGFTPVWRGLLLLPARRRPKQGPDRVLLAPSTTATAGRNRSFCRIGARLSSQAAGLVDRSDLAPEATLRSRPSAYGRTTTSRPNAGWSR